MDALIAEELHHVSKKSPRPGASDEPSFEPSSAIAPPRPKLALSEVKLSSSGLKLKIVPKKDGAVPLPMSDALDATAAMVAAIEVAPVTLSPELSFDEEDPVIGTCLLASLLFPA